MNADKPKAMRVADLISALQKMPQDAVVWMNPEHFEYPVVVDVELDNPGSVTVVGLWHELAQVDQ